MNKELTGLPKYLRDDMYSLVSYGVVGLLGVVTGLFLFVKAHRYANEFISMNPHRETALLFKFAFLSSAALLFLVVGVPLAARALLAGPQRRALTLMSKRIEELELRMKQQSEHQNPELSSAAVASDEA